MMISLVRAGIDDNSLPKNSKSTTIIKNSKKNDQKPQKFLKKPQKYMFIKDQKERKYSKNFKCKTG